MGDFLKRKVHLVILALIFILLISLSLMSEGYYGGTDNISHYLISHYSFKYPHLLLNSWGRPFYTILSAPFAQFGLQAVKLLNILLGLFTAWLAFRVATVLKIKPAFLVLVFVCFTPIYFLMMPTALTEILFSFVLLLSVFLFIRGNYIASAVVISFIPFARTEGFILLPLFLLAFLWARQYKAIPGLAAGVIFFSLLGSFYYKDLLWVYTQFPYPVTYHHPIYNKAGSLWHFLESREFILGLPLEILFLAGIIGIFRDFFSDVKTVRHQVHLLASLALGPLLLYFAFHAVLFWKALGGSMGLDRVLAAVMPLAALIALKGYEALEKILGQNRYTRKIFMIAIIIVVVINPFRKNVLPFPLSPEEKTIKEAAAWIKTSPYANRDIFYTDNNVPYYLGADPYQRVRAGCYQFGDSKYLDTIPVGSLLVWDSHFGANESKVPLDSLLGNDRQQVVGYFSPEKPWITFGGYDYECYITRTLEPGILVDNYAIRDSLKEILDEKTCYKPIYQNTFENLGNGWESSFLTGDTVHRGKKAYRMDQRTEYSPGLCQAVSTLKLKGEKPGLRVSLYVNLPLPDYNRHTLLIISFEHRNKPYSYTAVNLNKLKVRAGKWTRVTLESQVPAFLSKEDLVKTYIWNPGKQVFYLDDLKVDMTAIKN